MKTSQNQLNQQEYEDDVTDEHQMMVGIVEVCSHQWVGVPAVVRFTARKMMFGVFIGYYSISL